MNRIIQRIATLVVLLQATAATAEETATLKATFRYLGRPSTVQPITPHLDRQFCGSVPIPDERLIVHDDHHGIKNVVVYVYTGRRGTVLPERARRPETHVLAIKHCRFDPHILLAQKGDTLRVEDQDPVGHNVNLQFFNNAPLGFTRPVGAAWQRSLDESEPAPVPIGCNIHPWMNAYLLVLDHRLAGISDGDGRLEITGLPVGQKIVFRAFHESARLKEVVVDATAETWEGSKFERVLQAGVNDLGVIGIPASAFTIDRRLDGEAGEK